MVAQVARVEWQGRLVGALAYGDKSGVATFEYCKHWLQSGIEIAPLQMPLALKKYRFSQLPWETFRGLPAVLADSLPDYFGDTVVNAWLASQGRDPDSFSAIERLLYSGSRGMGALEYGPAMPRDDNMGEDLVLETLVDSAQQLLDQRVRLINTASENPVDCSSLCQVGASAGGARPKAVVAIDDSRTIVRSGQLAASPGFTHCLLKFDGVNERAQCSELWGDSQGYGLMEYAYYLMATAAGITMMPSEVLRDGARAHFLTQRFDRVGNTKLHVQTLCAMAHADYRQPGAFSYEELLGIARQLRLPREDAVQIFRRMVFNVIARNHGDHTKNTAFVMSGEGVWRLAPAYDMVFSYKPGSYWVERHQMSINGKRDQFTHGDLMAVAHLIGNFDREAEKIIAHIIAIVKTWRDYADEVGVLPQLRDHIAGLLRLELSL